MPGIWGILSEKEIQQKIDLASAFHKESGVAYLVDSAKFSKASFGRFSVDKFQSDKIFKETGHSLISTEGIILNLKNLLCQYNTGGLDELILKLYNQNNWKFIEKLRGNFSGFVYSENNMLIVFTDHLASKPIYYFHDKDSNTLIFASELKVVIEGMRKLGFIPHLDVKGAYYLLTFAYMLGDTTLVEEVKKLPPGNVLICENGGISLKEYYKLSSEPYIEGDEDEIIEELDRRFREAIKLEYEKDLEYGYSHIATLSGGLDSRTNVAYAQKLGFSNITCFTFSESGYLDEKIAKKICLDNHFEFLFYALDNGDYLVKYIDEIVSANDGLVLYSGSAHGYNCLRKISLQDFGLVHTGQLGDGAMGSYLDAPIHNKTTNKLGEYSDKLITHLEPSLKNMLSKNSNSELFKVYNRMINGMSNGDRMTGQFTEFSSPFLYVDFLDYAMKIHPKHRYKQALYPKWINKSIPEFSNYKWEKYNLAPKYPLFFMDMYNKARFAVRIATRRLGLNQRHTSMNPTEYWWRTNEALREKINSIFKENMEVLGKYPDLLKDSNYLFKEGSFLEKTQVITLIKAVDLLNLRNPK